MFKTNEKMKKKVIFICTHNSARSQMAEGLLRDMYGDTYQVYSAGTAPSRVNPYAIKVMDEIGIDISNHTSKNVDDLSGIEFDIVVTVCDHAKENCPVFHGGDIRLHHNFRDPSKFRGKDEEILAGFRGIRDEIRDWIALEFTSNNVSKSGQSV